MSKSHFTISFPLKAPVDTMGTIHYSRFSVLSEKTLLFLGDFDREFSPLMAALAKRAGPVFDANFQHEENPPSTPVASNADAFAEWTAKHLLRAATLFSAYPDVTAKDIKAMASAAGITCGSEQLPFLVILPIKSRLAFIEVQLLLHARARKTQKDLGTVGTPHFAQFVPLENNQVGFFTVYDRSFDKYIADFTKYIGPVFDLIFKFTKDPLPSPCRKYLGEVIDFAAAANRAPIGLYQAYPGLSVQDIHALIADSKAISDSVSKASKGVRRPGATAA